MNAFREMRITANMTQAEVALALNVDQTAVSQWETGASKPRIDRLLKLAKLYGCTVDDLMKEERV